MKAKFKTAAIGGTFDRLHKGHRYFISEAFKLGERVIIGLTSDEFAKEKLSGFQQSGFQVNIGINNYNERKRELEEFLREKNLLKRAEIVMINDIYGPTTAKIKNQKSNDKSNLKFNIEALLVTKETLAGAIKVNQKRRELGFPELEIIEIPLVNAEDKKRISSTRIRLGEIDRWGKVFVRRLSDFGSKIPEEVRLKLKKPLGTLISGTPESIEKKVRKIIADLKPTILITIGDKATQFFNETVGTADIAVIDFHIKRIKVHEKIEDLGFSRAFFEKDYENKIIKARNPAGSVTGDIVYAVRRILESFVTDGKKRVIVVDGEEDLVGVPAILLAPLGSLVFYGQPGIILPDFPGKPFGILSVPGKPVEGIVAVEVTEEKKREILELIHTP